MLICSLWTPNSCDILNSFLVFLSFFTSKNGSHLDLLINQWSSLFRNLMSNKPSNKQTKSTIRTISWYLAGSNQAAAQSWVPLYPASRKTDQSATHQYLVASPAFIPHSTRASKISSLPRRNQLSKRGVIVTSPRLPRNRGKTVTLQLRW